MPGMPGMPGMGMPGIAGIEAFFNKAHRQSKIEGVVRSQRDASTK